MNKIILNLDLREGLFTLNEGTIEALGRPRQVQILINIAERMLVLRACGTEDIEAVVLPSEKTMATEIGARSIMKQIKQKMNWNDDRTRECIGVCYPDNCFEQNYNAAKAAGLDVGAYWYSYADSAEDAVKEAKACMEVIKGKKFEYPIYFDLEEQSQFAKGRNFCDSVIKAFCGELEKNGYLAGLYCSTYYLNNYVSNSVAGKYALWVAQYNYRCTYTANKYGIWQYSDEGRINGISGNVDMDYCYTDYPNIVKNGGYNGYKKTAKKTTSTATTIKKKTVDELAKEVIAGKWSAGDERKHKLTAAGYDYNAVQKKVNELMAKPTLKSVDEIAKEVIQGKWGNGDERKQKLTSAGYDGV